MLKIFILLLAIFTISACSSKSGHTPDAMAVLAPLAKPINKVTSALYKKKQNKVEQYLSENYEPLKNNIQGGNGRHLDELIRLINRSKNQAYSRQNLQQRYDYIFNNSRDTVVRIDAIASNLMTPGIRRNMLPFETRMAFLNEIKRDHQAYRLAIKNKNTNYLEKTANILAIPQNMRQGFYAELFKQYHSIYIEPVATKILWIVK